MILADIRSGLTISVRATKNCERLRAQGQIVVHSWIIAELAFGSLRDRAKTLATLDLLPRVRVAQLSEVRLMIEARRLYSLGIGLTDAQLIASIFLNAPTLLWTRDKPLRRVARVLGIHAALA